MCFARTGAVGGQPHQRNFSILCCVGKLRESGAGGSKKDAKREAAQKMIDKLKCLGPNSSAAPVADVAQPEMDEEMLNKLNNLKVETLNSAASQKVAGFYRKLQTAGGSKLASLHMTSLKGRTGDYVAMLGELGKEQKFEVTYVEVEEKCDDDSTQCLVQLSTLPVAVSKTNPHNFSIIQTISPGLLWGRHGYQNSTQRRGKERAKLFKNDDKTDRSRKKVDLVGTFSNDSQRVEIKLMPHPFHTFSSLTRSLLYSNELRFV